MGYAAVLPPVFGTHIERFVMARYDSLDLYNDKLLIRYTIHDLHRMERVDFISQDPEAAEAMCKLLNEGEKL
jgi:hypothetical protein